MYKCFIFTAVDTIKILINTESSKLTKKKETIKNHYIIIPTVTNIKINYFHGRNYVQFRMDVAQDST